ncbi:MAG: PilZ domain-containing protein [Thiohalorhabdus sp.]|uniref:PilZ domain-containing protein n=1 Tax=Thiohalorhabdus sp. TaxID=3094134 RepID=UPI00397FD3CE
MQDQIQDFRDLLSRMDGLVNAAWNAEIDPRMCRQLAAVRQRAVRIQGHLTGEANPGFPAPTPKPAALGDGEELVERFNALVEAARASDLSTTLTHYLHNAGLRLTFLARGNQQRLASRQVPDPGRTAYLQQDDTSTHATLVDTSPFGLGVETDTALTPDSVVRVVVVEPDGRSRTYECLVAHCRPLDSGYHLGLEIFTSKL